MQKVIIPSITATTLNSSRRQRHGLRQVPGRMALPRLALTTASISWISISSIRRIEQWKALFDYLAKTDLLSIPGGKHKIPGSSLTISVEDSKNDPLEKRGSESHNHHIDFQYVVKGVERFGIIDHYTSTPNCKYRPDVIHYDYKKCHTKFYDSTPDEFFIFFPRDWHIAKVANDTDNQDIRVLVIKVDYKD